MTTPRETIDLLRAARERILTPERWTQGVFARDQRGVRVICCHESAACWCVLGSILAEATTTPAIEAAEIALTNTLGPSRFSDPSVSIGTWNDDPGRTHAEVLNLFDRTIARLEVDHG